MPEPSIPDTTTSRPGGRKSKANGDGHVSDTDIAAESFEDKPDLLADVEGLGLSQDYAELAVATKKILKIPVVKPHRQQFVRTHPDPAMWFRTAMIEIKDEREHYIVPKQFIPIISEHVIPKVLIPYVTRKGDLLLWPIKLPDEDGRIDDWNESALDAAKTAIHVWCKIVGNRSLGCYEPFIAQDSEMLGDPEFPDLSRDEIIRIAFKRLVIDREDHPVIRDLLGRSA